MRLKMSSLPVALTTLAVLTAACGPTATPPAQKPADKPPEKAAPAKEPVRPAAGTQVTIGSNPSGSLFYSLAGGLAKLLSESAGLPAIVQPYAGSSTFLPLLNTGELDMGVVNAVDMAMAYRGPDKLKVGGRNPFQATPNARLVVRGSPLYLVEFVRKDSDIKSVAQLKGRKVTGEYNAHLAVWFNQFGVLASCGLTFNDVQVVPVPAVNEGLDALVQGRAEAAPFALDAAKVKEADAAVGIRAIPICADEQGKKRVAESVPGYYAVEVKSGKSTGIVEDTWVIGYDLYLAANKDLSEDVVYQTTKAFWEQNATLPPIHAGFAEWTTDRAVNPDVTIPYHPGAIRLFREKGAWKAGMDDLQAKLLKEAAP